MPIALFLWRVPPSHRCSTVPARELCRKHAISDATFYTWRKKYGGMEVP
ncbi:transposase, partial [Enterobacter asburiae]